jgi:hypothetical protein
VGSSYLFSIGTFDEVEDMMPFHPKYVVDDNGNRVAVLLELDDYYTLLNAWEQLAEILAEQENSQASGP